MASENDDGGAPWLTESFYDIGEGLASEPQPRADGGAGNQAEREDFEHVNKDLVRNNLEAPPLHQAATPSTAPASADPTASRVAQSSTSTAAPTAAAAQVPAEPSQHGPSLRTSARFIAFLVIMASLLTMWANMRASTQDGAAIRSCETSKELHEAQSAVHNEWALRVAALEKELRKQYSATESWQSATLSCEALNKLHEAQSAAHNSTVEKWASKVAALEKELQEQRSAWQDNVKDWRESYSGLERDLRAATISSLGGGSLIGRHVTVASLPTSECAEKPFGVKIGDVGVVESLDAYGQALVNFPGGSKWSTDPENLHVDLAKDNIRPGQRVQLRHLPAWSGLKERDVGLVVKVLFDGVAKVLFEKRSYMASLKELQIFDGRSTKHVQIGSHVSCKDSADELLAFLHMHTPREDISSAVGVMTRYKRVGPRWLGRRSYLVEFPNSPHAVECHAHEIQLRNSEDAIRPGKLVMVKPHLAGAPQLEGVPTGAGVVREISKDGVVSVRFAGQAEVLKVALQDLVVV